MISVEIMKLDRFMHLINYGIHVKINVCFMWDIDSNH